MTNNAAPTFRKTWISVSSALRFGFGGAVAVNAAGCAADDVTLAAVGAGFSLQAAAAAGPKTGAGGAGGGVIVGRTGLAALAAGDETVGGVTGFGVAGC